MSYLESLLVVYVVGMFFIGLPMGRWSLRAWQDPTNHHIALNHLFPMTTGTKSERELKFMNVPSSVSFHFDPEDTWESLATDGGRSLVGQYLLLQMVFWPVRLAWVLGWLIIEALGFLFLFMVGAVLWAIEKGGGVLGKSKWFTGIS